MYGVVERYLVSDVLVFSTIVCCQKKWKLLQFFFFITARFVAQTNTCCVGNRTHSLSRRYLRCSELAS